MLQSIGALCYKFDETIKTVEKTAAITTHNKCYVTKEPIFQMKMTEEAWPPLASHKKYHCLGGFALSK